MLPVPPLKLLGAWAAVTLPVLISSSKAQNPAFQELKSGEKQSKVLPAVPPHVCKGTETCGQAESMSVWWSPAFQGCSRAGVNCTGVHERGVGG